MEIMLKKRTPAILLTLASSLALGAAILRSASAEAQTPMPASPVRYTESIRYDLRRSLSLTGSVESRGTSTVASEVAGAVARLDAREGESVRKGAPIARLRPGNVELRLESARGELAEAKARLKLAESSLARARTMNEEGILSRQGLDDAIAQSEAWKGRVAQLGAEVRRLEDDLARTVIRAPFDAVVVRELTAPGQWVSAGGDVAELIDLRDLEVTVEVPSRYYSALSRGLSAQVRFDALGQQTVGGTVRAIVPRAHPQARTFPVKIAIPNRSGNIGVGMLATVELSLGGPSGRIMVPKDAIVSQGPRRLVFVIGGDNTVTPVPVIPGASQGAWIEVEGEIGPGVKVVTRGNERLRPGQTVQPQPLVYQKP